MKASKKGFSAVEILVIIAVICLAGILSWIAYEQLNGASDIQESDTSQETDTKTKQEETEFTKEIADWKTETIDRYGLRFKYPGNDGWTSTFGIVDSLLPGHEAAISINYTKCGTNCGFVLSIGVFDKKFEAGSQKDFGDKRMEGNDNYTLASKQTVIIDGVNGTRWEYTPGESGGNKIIYYYFSTDSYSYTFAVNNNGAVAKLVDLTETGEKIMRTLQFMD